MNNNKFQQRFVNKQFNETLNWDKVYTATGRGRHIITISLVISLCIFVRLAWINQINDSFYDKQLKIRIMRTLKLAAFRGNIFDRNDSPLAVSTPVASIWVDPTEVDAPDDATINKLATILNLDFTVVKTKLFQTKTSFVYLARSVSPEQEQAIKDLSVAGVYSIQEFKRYYPNGEVTSHIVGFNNIDDNGIEGIEYADNKRLKGKDGSEEVLRDLFGHVIENVGNKIPAQNGEQVNLAIDNRIQYVAYSALQKYVEKYQAAGGSAIVINAKTGEVLAMVNSPTFNPNDRVGVNLEQLRNRGVINLYEPGSTIKPFIIAKAIDDKLVTPSTVFDTNPYTIGPKLIRDTHDHPHLSVAEILNFSSDVGTSKIALKYQPEQMWNYYTQLGFGQPLHTGFPGEAKGIFLNWHKWVPLDQASMSYGYAMSVSLLQMVHSYTLFTNNGCLVPISFYKLDKKQDNSCKEQIISPETAKTMRTMLSNVVQEGTGKNAQLADYTSAGKTGTAHKASKAGYAEHSYIGSFVGYAPAEDPEIIVGVMIDDPKGSYYGGTVAAPVFNEIAGPALHTLGIKPDKSSDVQKINK